MAKRSTEPPAPWERPARNEPEPHRYVGIDLVCDWCQRPHAAKCHRT